MWWFLLLSLVSLYYLGKIVVAIWYDEDAFIHSKSTPVEQIRPQAAETLDEAVRRVRTGEFSRCKHAKYNDAGSCVPVCARLPTLLGDKSGVRELFASQRQGMLARSTYQHCLGTAVEAFVQRDFAYARSYYLCAHLLNAVIAEQQLTDAAMDDTFVREEREIGDSEEHLLRKLQSQVPCQCLELQDPVCAHRLLDDAVPCLVKANKRTACHYCHQATLQAKKRPCVGRCGLVEYCSVQCRKLDAETHSQVCGKQPVWWGGQ